MNAWRTVGWLAVVAWVTATAAAHAGPADDHVARGLAYYAEEEYAQAAEEFEAAYELAPTAATLFGWAQATRLAGDCDTAVTLYARFIEQAPTPEDAEGARAAMALCPEQSAPAPVEPEVVSEPAPTPPVASRPQHLRATVSTSSGRARWRVHLRVDVDLSHGGAVVSPGAAVRILGGFELVASALIGRDAGFDLGARFALGRGTVRPFIAASAPVFVTGETSTGARGSVGLRVHVTERVAATGEVGGYYGIEVPDGFDDTLLLATTALEVAW